RTGALHRAGIIFIFNSRGEIFMQHRAKKETFPDCFDASCAFHVAFGETYEEAAERELFEELGIRAELKLISRFTHFDPPENEIVAVFIGHSDETPEVDPEEAYSGEWCMPDRLNKTISEGRVTPWLRDGWKSMQGLPP
ncbi:MAG: NUDIX domain-containing protein, partial [Candidatus Aenigmarchaeota archaeon]|nr:NUDIX domain-containing protein [Candidatus Aenigmarchaeota archaeon]